MLNSLINEDRIDLSYVKVTKLYTHQEKNLSDCEGCRQWKPEHFPYHDEINLNKDSHKSESFQNFMFHHKTISYIRRGVFAWF